MNVRRIAAVAAVGILAAGAYAPATAAPKKKPITKTYDLQLLPVPDPPSGSSCLRDELEGISIHTETIKPTGPGMLSIKVTKFAGDWDITLTDKDGEEMATGTGTTTGGGAPATDGTDTLELKIKKAQELRISVCNFAGSPSATASFTYKYF